MTLRELVGRLKAEPYTIVGKTHYRVPRPIRLSELRDALGEPKSIGNPFPEVMVVTYVIEEGTAKISGPLRDDQFDRPSISVD